MNLDNHILQALRAGSGQALTIGELAREFGADSAVVLAAARRLVDSGQAAPAVVSVHGVPTLRGLTPLPASARTSP